MKRTVNLHMHMCDVRVRVRACVLSQVIIKLKLLKNSEIPSFSIPSRKSLCLASCEPKPVGKASLLLRRRRFSDQDLLLIAHFQNNHIRSVRKIMIF